MTPRYHSVGMGSRLFTIWMVIILLMYAVSVTPMRLVAPWEVPKGVGLVEYNKYKFSVELTEENKFQFKGLRVVKKSQHRSISPFQVDNATAYIARRRTNSRLEKILETLKSRNGNALFQTDP